MIQHFKVINYKLKVLIPQKMDALDNALINSDIHRIRKVLEQLLCSLIGTGSITQGIMTRLLIMDQKSQKFSLLPINSAHIGRVIQNSMSLLSNKEISNSLTEMYGDNSEKVIIIGSVLSEIGFSSDSVDVNNRNSYKGHKSELIAFLDEIGSTLQSSLKLSDTQYSNFIEAVVRSGNFGDGARENENLLANDAVVITNKYENSLTSIITLAQNMDVSQIRVPNWLQSQVSLFFLTDVFSHPSVMSLYVEDNMNAIRDELDTAKGRITETQRSKEDYSTNLRQAIMAVIGSRKELFLWQCKGEGQTDQEALLHYEKFKGYVKNMSVDGYRWLLSSYFTSKASIDKE